MPARALRHLRDAILARRLGQRRHPPARGRRRGPQLAVLAQDQSGDAAGPGGQLQAPAGGEIKGLDLAQHGRQGGHAQALLHGPQDLGITAPAGHDQLPRIKAESRQPGTIKRPPFIDVVEALAPQNGRRRTLQTGQTGQ